MRVDFSLDAEGYSFATCPPFPLQRSSPRWCVSRSALGLRSDPAACCVVVSPGEGTGRCSFPVRRPPPSALAPPIERIEIFERAGARRAIAGSTSLTRYALRDSRSMRVCPCVLCFLVAAFLHGSMGVLDAALPGFCVSSTGADGRRGLSLLNTDSSACATAYDGRGRTYIIPV